MGVVLVLVYVERDQQIRVISLRRASKQERIRFVMPNSSKTNWSKVQHEASNDAPVLWDTESDVYNPNDEDAVNAFWETALITSPARRGKNRQPIKEQIAIRFSADVLQAFRASGKGWQTRMDEALKDWLKTHSPVS
jgi:uncharacterized protein (DUF4415 family)